MSTPPYDQILESQDRSWSLRLLERLVMPDLSEEERGKLVSVLTALEDPRCAQPLQDILTNPQYPAGVRENAGVILRGCDFTPEDSPTLRNWWQSDDEILQLHAIISMGPEEADIIEQVAADPEHRFHQNAIAAMHWNFELPRHLELKIRAMSHPDVEVRKTAIFAMLWDEPVSGESALLAATYDPVPEVVVEACNVLQWYSTQKSLRRMAELRSHEDKAIRTEAEDFYQWIRGRFQWYLTGNNRQLRKHIRRWLEPVWDELAFTRKELKREKLKKPPQRQKRKSVSIRRTLKLLRNPDTSPLIWHKLFYDRDWSDVPERKRRKLKPILLQHPDSQVRAHATEVLHTWGDQRGLVAMLSDPDFFVRKSAMYRLGKTPPYSPKIARVAWKHLQRPDAIGTHGSETLETYSAHAKPKQAIPHLAAMAQDPEQPEYFRAVAISWLHEYAGDSWAARIALVKLMYLLEQEPTLTWVLHIYLLYAAEFLKFTPPNLEHLRTVDHLDMQEALASF